MWFFGLFLSYFETFPRNGVFFITVFLNFSFISSSSSSCFFLFVPLHYSSLISVFPVRFCFMFGVHEHFLQPTCLPHPDIPWLCFGNVLLPSSLPNRSVLAPFADGGYRNAYVINTRSEGVPLLSCWCPAADILTQGYLRDGSFDLFNTS